jgi:serine/threonine-protein kinase
MRPRRHLAPSFFSTIAGRRLVRQASVVALAFIAGYLVTVFWLFPAPLFSSDHAVPRVVERDIADAKERLERQGFRAKVAGEEADPKAARGIVLWQDPAPGTVLPKGTVVQLTTSTGPAPVAIADVVGMDESLARRVIEASGLTIGGVDSIPASDERGVVIATRPGAGVARDAGTAVVLVVSSGPAEINVPDVIGLTQKAAAERITQAGLRPGSVVSRAVAGKLPGTVIDQRPAPGTLSARDGRVDLILARKPTP